jgi:acyl transferase domain-containing protein/surfactin synthase thioesterase subunit/acyl carrier protein
MSETPPVPDTDIAIVGIACRFPGASSATEFWDNLCRGVESITRLSLTQLRQAGVDEQLIADPRYVAAEPVLDDVDGFDASFFGYSPHEARLIDPQQRLFLEVCWQALEDAGYRPDDPGGPTGVFGGAGGVVTSYLVAHHAQEPALLGSTGSLSHIGNDKDFLTTRVSYKLNLTGPSVAVQTACSTSLVALHLACRSLLDRECDMALAGASVVRFPHRVGYLSEKGDIRSPDGHVYAFDDRAHGTVFGSGAGVVLLKPLSAALRDRDHVYAVVKATTINNDGAQKISYTASSVDGQARAIVEALALADVSPDSVSYVECHGAGTHLGDPLEIQALTRAFRTGSSRRRYCAIGSVKTNIGHLEQSAGIAGLIKTAMVLEHGVIPPTLNYATPNSRIDLDNSPFVVADQLREFGGEGPRRACVNALGLGGTNAFAVLEQAPTRPAEPEPVDRPWHVMTLGAHTRRALSARCVATAEQLRRSPPSLADACFTANLSGSRSEFHVARAAGSTLELAALLEAVRDGDVIDASDADHGPLTFLFPGQGTQRPLSTVLYDSQPVFRAALDRCAELADPQLDHPLLSILFADDGSQEAALLHHTELTQPATVAIGYALARMWASWGVVPEVVLGHSVGELTAACVAGCVSIEELMPFVVQRARLMAQRMKAGSMASVFARPERFEARLDPRVSIAVVNGPEHTVIAGPRSAVRHTLAELAKAGIGGRALHVSRAFHSPMTEPILDELEALAASMSWRAPRVQMISNLDGAALEHAPDRCHWRRHAREPVRFDLGLATVVGLGARSFVELGSGSAMLTLGRACLPHHTGLWLASLGEHGHEWETLARTVAALAEAGRPINWRGFDAAHRRRRVPLPTTRFQRKRFAPSSSPRRASSPGGGHPLLGVRLRSVLKPAQFETRLDLAVHTYLDDHRIHGLPVLPTAAILEMARAAGVECLSGPVSVSQLVYHEALVLPEDGPLLIQLLVERDSPTRASFRLVSCEDDPTVAPSWRHHVTGELQRQTSPAPRPSEGIAAVRTRCDRRIDVDDFYRGVATEGLGYGPAFRGIREIHWREAEVLTRVELPAVAGEATRYGLHPALLDASLHVYPLLAADGPLPVPGIADDLSVGRRAYLPIAVERFEITGDALATAWVHARRRVGENDETLVVDLQLLDDQGTPTATLVGLSLRRLDSNALEPRPEQLASWCYRLRWVSVDLDATAVLAPTRWLLLADEGGVAPRISLALRARGHEVRTLSERAGLEVALEGVSHVVGCWALDVPASTELGIAELDELTRREHELVATTLSLFVALGSLRERGVVTPALTLLTRAAVPAGPAPGPCDPLQAMLWGIGRTVALEMPPTFGGIIDLPPDDVDIEALATALLTRNHEDQLALRGGVHYAARLSRVSSLEPRRAPILAEAIYLISGGLGALGLLIARWLVVEAGARHLVLTSRRGSGPEHEAALAELRATGAELEVLALDITQAEQVSAMFERLGARELPLRGVFHCAGVLDDGVITQMSMQQFCRVTAPKVRGGFLLDRHTRALPLDHFVLFSSVLGLTGSAGQINYAAANTFLDALGDARRAQGLPALTLDWGPWGSAGLAVSAGERGQAMWRARGTQYIPADAGVTVFARALASDASQLAVTITDWDVYLGQFSRVPALYTELGSKRTQRGRDEDRVRGLVEQLAVTPPQARRSLRIELVAVQLSQLLELDAPPLSDRPLSELGVDSLIAVTLVNRLEDTLGIVVPLSSVIVGPTIEQLVDALFGAETSAKPDVEIHTLARPEGQSIRARGWLVIARPRPTARVRLLCFPFAGGGSAVFHDWASRLDPAIEVVAIESPGRLHRISETPLRSMRRLIAALLPQLLAEPDDRPLALFGHCLGALISFEVARALIAAGRPAPVALFVSGARPPDRLQRVGPFERSLTRSLLEQLGFDPLDSLHEQPDEVFARAIRHFDIGLTEIMLEQAELRDLMLPTIRADFELAYNYLFVPGAPVASPICCFYGTEDSYVDRTDAMAWGQFTRSDFLAYSRPGRHFLLVEDGEFMLAVIERELLARLET